MITSLDKIRADFDRLARLTAEDADQPGYYDTFLLRQIPPTLRRALEVGCGAGGFCRRLADRGHQVTGIDLSPEMLHVARQRTRPSQAVTYVCGDFFNSPLNGPLYDCVISIATLHHFQLKPAVERLASWVRPGGLLVIHDLTSDVGVGDRMWSSLAVVARGWARVRRGRLRERPAVRAAWDEHGRDEQYMTMTEVAAWSRALLPGSAVYRHLQWRYTVVWRKPDSG